MLEMSCMCESTVTFLRLLIPITFYLAVLYCYCYCDMAQSLLLSLSFFFTGQGLRGLDVLRCRCSSQFLTPGPVSSLSQLTHSDSFEPLGGAVSGSSGFYTFTESLHPEMLPGTSALQQCAH